MSTTKRASRVRLTARRDRENYRSTAQFIADDVLAIANGDFNPIDPTVRELAVSYLEKLADGQPLQIGTLIPFQGFISVDVHQVRRRGSDETRTESIVHIIPSEADQGGFVTFAAATIADWGIEVRRCNRDGCGRFFYKSDKHKFQCSEACTIAQKRARAAEERSNLSGHRVSRRR